MSDSFTAPVVIAPSVLAADWSDLRSETKKILEAGADWLHLDVMDGHFVPPITFGPQFVQAIRKQTTAFLDVHLMIASPEQQIAAFAAAGADLITVHAEACVHLHRTIQQIKEAGVKAGLALNPGTPLIAAEPVLGDIDLLLVMTVNPGWGGQTFIESTLEKIRAARGLVKQRNIRIEVDGGINAETALKAWKAGADTFVAGTYIFGQQDYRAQIESLRKPLLEKPKGMGFTC